MQLSRIVLAVTVALAAGACAQIPAANETQPAAAQMTTESIRMAEAEQPAAPATEPAAAPEQPVSASQPDAPVAVPAPVATQEPEAAPADLWIRIRKGFRKNDLDGPLVRQWEQWYASRPDYVARMMRQGSRVLFHVVEEVERRNMPSEIALLPMIESAYNPQAYSVAHASGIWQFIPSTGKLYGLQQDFWYDGRRDIVAATTAALDYLEKLYAMFNDWDLALASYNWGEGAVQRAVARNEARGLPTDYENLRMPAETRHYLPKLQAVKNIVADPGRFGLVLDPIPNEPYFALVSTPQHIDVAVAAKLAGIPVEEFRFLNPAHNKPVINANRAEVIVLPRHAVATFKENLERHDAPLASWQAYQVKPGDRIEKVAARFGISVDQLKQINHLHGRNKFRTGMALLVPVKAGARPDLPNLPAPAIKTANNNKPQYTPRKATTQKVAQKQSSGKKPAGKPTRPSGGKPPAPGKTKIAGVTDGSE